ncbi:MAG: hypothetical protein IPK77_10610 [Cellvibrio sp.]|nr:hypothetical protein [Cellvibrio sp.]
MRINKIEVIFSSISETSLSGTCKVDAAYDDGMHISEDVGCNFQMHACIENGIIVSRGDKMLDGSELDAIWLAVSDLSKKMLAESASVK